jgi:hypothetical protein
LRSIVKEIYTIVIMVRHGGTIVLLAVILVVILIASALFPRSWERFDMEGDQSASFWASMTEEGKQVLCATGLNDPTDPAALAACGARKGTFGDIAASGKVAFNDKIFFRDPSMNAEPNWADNSSDPYYLEKVITSPNASSLRLTLNDDADESLQIWGDSCQTTGCSGPGVKGHHFRADGSAAHRGAVVAGSPDTAADMWGFNFGLHSYNPKVNAWSHFPWGGDGKNYIRGDLQVDGKTNFSGSVTVADKVCIGNTCITEANLVAIKSKSGV